MCLAQGPQRSDADEAWSRGPSVSSQALYNWAYALTRGPVDFRGVSTIISKETYSNLWFSGGSGPLVPPLLEPSMLGLLLSFGRSVNILYSKESKHKRTHIHSIYKADARV